MASDRMLHGPYKTDVFADPGIYDDFTRIAEMAQAAHGKVNADYALMVCGLLAEAGAKLAALVEQQKQEAKKDE